MTIAVTGASGQLGSELCRQLQARATSLTRHDLDVSDLDQVRRTLGRLRPQSVINAAAYNDVDRAEREESAARAVNAVAVRHLAETCADLDCPLLHVSTDYVFGGDTGRRTPYTESDPPSPLSAYGRSKLEGENCARQWHKHFVVRTCGLYRRPGRASEPRSFVEKMLSLAGKLNSLHVVDDQCCTPSFVPDVARAIVFLLDTEAYGTYHVTNRGETTWFQFAREIFRLTETQVDLQPITSDAYAASRPADRPAAPRPRYSVLDPTKFESLGGPQLPHWTAALQSCLLVS